LLCKSNYNVINQNKQGITEVGELALLKGEGYNEKLDGLREQR
jgi:hypothetical protein